MTAYGQIKLSSSLTLLFCFKEVYMFDVRTNGCRGDDRPAPVPGTLCARPVL
jgi:hypothetical protein